jgi:putative oxidoreductase
MQAIKLNTANTRTTDRASARALRIALWILQILMAALFLWHGLLLLAPPAEMVQLINESMGQTLRLFIGAAEVLAAIGLILPALTRILPQLTVWAAVGLMPIMAGASVLHILRDETSSAVSTAVIFVLVTLIAVGRAKLAPIAPRCRSRRRV